MVRYHLSRETGKPNQCKAKEGNCPFKTEEGVERPHYATKEDARAGYEVEQRAEQELIRQKRDAAAEKRWPTPSDEKIEAFENANPNYSVYGKKKTLESETEDAGLSTRATVRSGQLNASVRFRNHFGAGLSINQVPDFTGKSNATKFDVAFNDFGTNLSIQDAEAHVKEMEQLIAKAPTAIDEANEAVEKAEKLFGRPSDETHPMYSKVDQFAPAAPPKPPTIQKYIVNEGTYPTYHFDEAGLNNSRIHPQAYLGHKGSLDVSISMPSRSDMSFEDYQERAQNLRNAIATAKQVENDYKNR